MSLIAKSELEKRIIPCSQRFGQKGEGAEWYTASYLAENLNPRKVGDFRILINYNLERGQDKVGSLEIDLLVINRYGIFLIEVKDWRGEIVAYDGFWLQGGGKKLDDVFGVLEYKSKKLHSKLFGNNGELKDIGNVSVVGLIVLRQGLQRFRNESKNFTNSKNVLDISPRLILALNSSDFLHKGSNSYILQDQDIQRISNTLYHSHEDGALIVGHYRIEKELLPGELFDAYEGINTTIDNKRVRIKCYKLPHITKNDKTVIENFERSARAVSTLDHTNILQTYDFFQHPNRADVYYEITEPINGKRLDEVMEQCDLPLHLAEQLSYLKPLCNALAHAHAQGIYHRNISPETVFITKSGRVKLADFDFAKMVGLLTIATPGQLLVDNILTAPELRRNPSSASSMSDIYSLGGLWYLLASLPDHPTRIELEKIRYLNIPEKAQLLMARMLSEKPNDRFRSTEDILKSMNDLDA